MGYTEIYTSRMSNGGGTEDYLRVVDANAWAQNVVRFVLIMIMPDREFFLSFLVLSSGIMEEASNRRS